MRRTLVALVEDKPGVLNRIVSLFRRRNFNIESLTVGHSEQPGVSRLTMVVEADNVPVEQFVYQLDKLINVIDVTDLTETQSVVRELALVKVKADSGTRGEIMQLVDVYRAKIVDVSLQSLVDGGRWTGRPCPVVDRAVGELRCPGDRAHRARGDAARRGSQQRDERPERHLHPGPAGGGSHVGEIGGCLTHEFFILPGRWRWGSTQAARILTRSWWRGKTVETLETQTCRSYQNFGSLVVAQAKALTTPLDLAEGIAAALDALSLPDGRANCFGFPGNDVGDQRDCRAAGGTRGPAAFGLRPESTGPV